ncbi:SDR family oxidoreductase [Streptomyces sp. NPDC127190]|uniref:SDR family oxidoreductase n=1 Tax=unclassified Streptomyces TaxID=2593676 RepID=UPI00363CFD8A
MTVLITGATGFVGSRLAHALLTSRARRVIALGRGDLASLRRRVVDAVTLHGGVDADALRRLQCVSGDVTLPWLGLAPGLHARLAAEVDAVWHCAGDIALGGERGRLYRVNTHGTAQVLAFAEHTRPACRLIHVSTMAVAGNRPAGLVMEDDLSDFHGFVTHYDASKYEAERLVRDWASRHGRPVVVLRPGVVASDRSLPETAADHPLAMLGRMIETVASGGAPGIPAAADLEGGARLRLRLRASAAATFNIVPSDYATDAMIRIGHDTVHDGAVAHTYHIVHHSPTSLGELIRVFEQHYSGLHLQCVEDFYDATPAEEFIAAHLTGFLSYCRLQHRFDRTRTLAATPGLPEPAPVDRRFLQQALGLACPASADPPAPVC